MGSKTLAAVFASCVALAGGEALAQCAFDGPAKAKGLKTSLIRVFAGCPCATPCPPVPNSSTGTGVPSCAPPYAHSDYEFDSKGSCGFKLSVKREDPCSTGSGEPCMATSAGLKCKGILNPGGTTYANDSGWEVDMILRATIDDGDNGDMTMINIPVQAGVPPATDGRLTVKNFDPMALLIGTGFNVPDCTEIEIVRMSLNDPDGNPFATLGAGTRPKGF